MRVGGNNLTLGDNLNREIERSKADLPAGMDIGLVADQPKVVNESIHDFTESLLEAIVIVMAASFLSLGLWSGIVLALCIPVVVCATFLFMKCQGIDLHIVSLGALIVSLGLLVDDAIIVIEMMQVKLEEGMDRLSAAEAAIRAAQSRCSPGRSSRRRASSPSMAEGQTSEYCAALFWVIAAALLLSWVASIFVSPVLGYKFIQVKTKKEKAKEAREKGKSWKSSIGDKAYQIFYKLIALCIHFKKTVIVGTAGLFCLTLAMIPLVNQEFFPDSVRPEIILDVNLPQGLPYRKRSVS